jgi:DNA-binding beta-propeller fold protein YncE
MRGNAVRLCAFAMVAVLVAGCGGSEVAPSSSPATASTAPSALFVAPAASSVAPSPAATPLPYTKIRVFVASESTDSVFVLEGGTTFEVVAQIKVGTFPHNISVSPDGKWVATADRYGNMVSIIDPVAMKEISRVRVGRQPHDLIWQPDSKVLFVGHEQDVQIARIEAGTWKILPPLQVGVPQHDLAIAWSRPTELYYTVTNSNEADHLRMWDLTTGTITKIKVQDVHDVFFTPDEKEIWTTSSGFIGMMSDRIAITDPVTKTMKEEIHLPGRYPFHTMKHNRDGMFYPPDGTPMLLSDHMGPSLMFIDVLGRKLLSATKLGGEQAYHTTYDPIGKRLLATTNVPGAVSVIDLASREIVQTLKVPAAHGIVAIGLP